MGVLLLIFVTVVAGEWRKSFSVYFMREFCKFETNIFVFMFLSMLRVIEPQEQSDGRLLAELSTIIPLQIY